MPLLFTLALALAFTPSTPHVEFKSLPAEPLKKTDPRSPRELKGKVILVDFWASWCEPCKEALPHYNRLYKKYKDQGLIIMGINEDEDSKERDLFLKTHVLDFPIYTDKEKAMVQNFKVQALPSLFVFDRNMKAVALYRGFSPEKLESLEKKIQDLLNK